ncbi:MAG: universal stress protein [Thermoanaerobaculia bacterium]
MPKRILVPTDFSAASRAALREAVAVAEACSAELVVLYADTLVPSLIVEQELPNKFLDMKEPDQKSAIEGHLRKSIDEIVPKSVSVVPLVVIGSPATTILSIAKEKNADWIVMGTHGRTGVERLFAGSVTEEVLRHADRPVLAIHAAA